jgi:hypothetical protein
VTILGCISAILGRGLEFMEIIPYLNNQFFDTKFNPLWIPRKHRIAIPSFPYPQILTGEVRADPQAGQRPGYRLM